MNNAEILLIEDNESDAEIVVRALTKNKIIQSIKHVIDGEEAAEYLFCAGRYSGRNPNARPKLILLDLKMPKVNGMELLARIKTDERTKTIPVVVFTSSREERDLLEAYKLGANSYVVKAATYEAYSKTICEVGTYWLFINQLPS